MSSFSQQPFRSRKPHRFIGRERELAVFKECLAAAKHGEGSCILVNGEPGVGKTRFATEAASLAQTEGWRVLTGHAYDSEGMPPYLPFIEALQSYVQECPIEDLRSQLGQGAVDVAMLVREVRWRLPEVIESTPSTPQIERYHLFESICQFLESIAHASPSGLLLYLDDVHWADPSTLLLCQHLARRLSRVRILLLAAYRSEEVERAPSLLEFLAELARYRLERIALSRLTPEETQDLALDLTGVTPTPGVAQAIFEQTQGNAFFAGEVIRQLHDYGADLTDAGLVRTDWRISEGVRQVVRQRLSRLRPETRQLLEAASVLGERFGAEILPTVANLPGPDLAPVLEEAIQAGMLQEEPAGYSFRHPLIRRVIYENLGLQRRRDLHLAAAEAVEAASIEVVAPQLSVIAHHFHESLPASQQKALDYASRAGDHAVEVFAYEEAARMYQLAIDALQSLPDKSNADLLADLHLKRARAFAAITMWAEARHEFEAALPLLSAGRMKERAELLSDLAITCLWTNQTSMGQQYATEAKALAEAGLEDEILTAAVAATARLQFSDGQIEASVASYKDAIQRSRGQRIHRVDQLLPAYAHLLYLRGDYPAAIEQATACIEVSRQTNDFSSLIYALGDLGLSLAASGRYDDALVTFEEAESAGSEYGLTTFLARVRGMRAGPYLDLFNYGRAAQLAEAALDFGRSVDFQSTVVSAGIDLLFNYTQTGDVGRAESLLGSVAAEAANASDIHGWLWKLRLAQARAQIALARRDFREAMDLAGESAELSSRKRRTKYEVAALVTRGQALLGLGRKRDAIMELRGAVQIARPVGDPAMLLRASGALLAAEPDEALATEARSAVEVIIKGLTRPELLRPFEESDTVRLVRGLQKSRGGAASSRVSAYPKQLSDRKLEVLSLIAQGKTNHEIAETLVLSERTVQRHIADLYRSIDVRNRAEATAYAINRLGL